MIGDKQILKPTIIGFEEAIDDIIAGSHHSYAITKEGVYAWGRSDNCNLGQSIQKQQNVSDPQFIGISNIKGIATCSNHTFAWNIQGQVFSWGSNHNHQLGESQTRDYEIHKMQIYQEANQINIKVKQIACGQNHTIATLQFYQEKQDKQTRLFVWGQSKNCQLTLDTNLIIPYPVQSEENLSFKKIYSRSDFNIAICDDGIYGWGSNVFGRLGDGLKKQRIPKRIQVKGQIVRIGIGIHHVIGVTQKGQAFGWGFGKHGQLGIGKAVSNSEPNKMICNQKIVDASCGQQHTVVLLNNGKMMSCGSNKYSVLGHEQTDQKEKSLLLHQIQLEGACIIKISCGNRHNIALDNQGKVYVWGSNNCGQLGLKPVKDKQKSEEFRPQVKRASEKKISIEIEQNQIQNVSNGYLNSYSRDKNNEIVIWKQKYDRFLETKRKQQRQLLQQLQTLLRGNK